jgi:hypothetical protein
MCALSKCISAKSVDERYHTAADADASMRPQVIVTCTMTLREQMRDQFRVLRGGLPHFR